MKIVLLIATWISMSGVSHAQSSTDLSLHMRAMSLNLEFAKSKAEDAITYPEAAAGARELRSHVIGAVALVPQKLNSMTEDERRRSMLEYHQLMARLIYMAASLEDAFTAGQDYQSISVSREMDIDNLFHEIDKLMSYAHEKYR